MSEYWKSTPKYWCKHCSLYVKDTPFERKQHENTGKHQGNLKRFLRGIQNEHERSERDKERAKAEVERLNRVVGGAPSSQTVSSSSKHATRKNTATGPTATDQKRQWAQLAEMGIQVPDNFRGEMAMAGQWQTTSSRSEDLPSIEDSLSVGVRKRKLEGQEEEEEEEPGQTVVRRGWGSTTKRYPGQAEDNQDLDQLLKESIVKKDPAVKAEMTADPAQQHALKAESKLLADEMGDKTPTSEGGLDSVLSKSAVELEAAGAEIKKEDTQEKNSSLLEHAVQSTAAPVFKKRKAKSKLAAE